MLLALFFCDSPSILDPRLTNPRLVPLRGINIRFWCIPCGQSSTDACVGECDRNPFFVHACTRTRKTRRCVDTVSQQKIPETKFFGRRVREGSRGRVEGLELDLRALRQCIVALCE